jgi:ferredoxin--NADP+ reductase
MGDEVREIILDIEDPTFRVEVGQNIGVLAPGQKEFGQEHHFRLYTIADLPEETPEGHFRIFLCVKRCFYVDEYSGERYPGVASNYLCDLQEGDTITITGPYGQAFEVPPEPDAFLILIGAGTGIAPFRAFVKYLKNKVNFQGRILLFHGGRTGLDLLYRNDIRDDFTQYFDQETFEAVSALSDRPHWSDEIDWDQAIESRGEELWQALSDAKTYVYISGLEKIRDELDTIFAKVAGSVERWQRRKAELTAGHRWVELLY